MKRHWGLLILGATLFIITIAGMVYSFIDFPPYEDTIGKTAHIALLVVSLGAFAGAITTIVQGLNYKEK